MKSCGACKTFTLSCNNCKAVPDNKGTLAMLGITATVYQAPQSPTKMIDLDDLQRRGFGVFIKRMRETKRHKETYKATIVHNDSKEQIVFICSNLDKLIADVKHWCREGHIFNA